MKREAHVEDDVRRRLVPVRDPVLSQKRNRDSLHVLDDLRPPFLKSDFGSVGVVLSVESGDDGDDGGRDVRVSSASNGRVGDLQTRRDERKGVSFSSEKHREGKGSKEGLTSAPKMMVVLEAR